MLADANGLGGDDALVAGSTLTVPEVKTSLNDASTFKPYDPGEITGPTTPSLPYIPPPDNGCGAVGMLIMVAVTIAVSIATAGALAGLAASSIGQLGSAMLVGGIAGAAGSAAGQVVGNMTGVVDGFSFKDIAMGAVTGAIAGGLTQSFGAGAKAASGSGKVVDGATKFATYSTKAGAQLTNLGKAVVGMATYAGGVASNKLMGRDTDFSWKGVAASVVGSFAGLGVGSRVGGRLGVFSSSLAESTVTATVRRTFGMGKQDWGSILAQAAGSTVASMFSAQDTRQENRYTENLKEAALPIKQLTNDALGMGGELVSEMSTRIDDDALAMQSVSQLTYVVQPGDSLSTIGGNSRPETIGRLMALNGLASTTIHPGQVLVLEGADASGEDPDLYRRIGQAAMDQDRYSLENVDAKYFALYGSRERFYDQKKDMEYFQDQRPELWLSDSGSGPRRGRVYPRRNEPMEYGFTYKDGILPSGAFNIIDWKSPEYGTRALVGHRVHLADIEGYFGIFKLFDGVYASHAESYANAGVNLSIVGDIDKLGWPVRKADVLNWSRAEPEVGAQFQIEGEANITYLRLRAPSTAGGKGEVAIGTSVSVAGDAGFYANGEGFRFRALGSGSASLLTVKAEYENTMRSRWGTLDVDIEGRARLLSFAGAGGWDAAAADKFRFKPIAEAGGPVSATVSPHIEVTPNWRVIWSDVQAAYSAWHRLFQEKE